MLNPVALPFIVIGYTWYTRAPFSFLFQVVSPINKMIDTVPFNVLTYSLDWHPSDHLSFADNVTIRKLHESSKVRVCFMH